MESYNSSAKSFQKKEHLIFFLSLPIEETVTFKRYLKWRHPEVDSVKLILII